MPIAIAQAFVGIWVENCRSRPVSAVDSEVNISFDHLDDEERFLSVDRREHAREISGLDVHADGEVAADSKLLAQLDVTTALAEEYSRLDIVGARQHALAWRAGCVENFCVELDVFDATEERILGEESFLNVEIELDVFD